MNNRTVFANLRNTLAEVFPDEKNIQRVIKDADIHVERIGFDTSAVNVWQAILDEANRANRIENLVEVVQKEYPENKELRTVCWQVLQALPAAGNSPQGKEFLSRPNQDRERAQLAGPEKQANEVLKAPHFHLSRRVYVLVALLIMIPIGYIFRSELSNLLIDGTSPPPSSNGAVGYWQFEENSGLTAGDSSGNGNIGTLEGEVKRGPGIVGGGLMLDGKDDQVRIPDSPSLSIVGTGLTLEAWVKPDAVNDIQTLIHKERQYSLRLDKEKLTYADSITWNYGEIGYYGSVSAGVWSHLAVTFDGNNVRFYINGALVGTKARVGGLSDNEQPICLGSYNCGIEGTWFQGTLDEVAIYSRSLSHAEIQANYRKNAT